MRRLWSGRARVWARALLSHVAGRPSCVLSRIPGGPAPDPRKRGPAGQLLPGPGACPVPISFGCFLSLSPRRSEWWRWIHPESRAGCPMWGGQPCTAGHVESAGAVLPLGLSPSWGALSVPLLVTPLGTSARKAPVFVWGRAGCWLCRVLLHCQGGGRCLCSRSVCRGGQCWPVCS